MDEFSIDDILRQEIDVEKNTRIKLSGFCDISHQTLGLLIELLHKIPKTYDVETETGAYLSMFYFWFYNSIFTFRASIILFLKGYYMESHILCRNLIEVFVTMRYFDKHKGKLKSHLSLKKPFIKFKTIFDEILPDYYDTQYKGLLSNVAHGGIGSLLFKFKFESPKKGKAHAGVFYDEEMASLIMNQLGTYFLGYIRFYKKIHPKVILSLDVKVKNKLDEIEKLLEKNFTEHIELKGGENKWHQVSRAIFEI